MSSTAQNILNITSVCKENTTISINWQQSTEKVRVKIKKNESTETEADTEEICGFKTCFQNKHSISSMKIWSFYTLHKITTSTSMKQIYVYNTCVSS